MAMDIHFIDVGCGNMTLILFPKGTTYLYDCNVTDENEDAVLDYLSKAMGILLGSHHGSITFFDDPADDNHYYTAHIKKVKPSMTLVSVGPNVHDLPDDKAIELYEQYSSGSNQGHKVFTTQEKGNMTLTLKGKGAWSLKVEQ